jgi:adenylyltransferase/sulfurtransferase
MTLTREQVERYSRHIVLPEIGGKGQERLLNARVLVAGAGGLGSPAALYLAAAGVGTIGLADSDTVELSNLQRQIIHSSADVGRPKTESARARLQALNPDVKVFTHPERLASANILSVLEGYDFVVDGTDNFPTRYLINDACVLTGKPLSHGAIFRFEGQATTILPGEGPCYRCLYPEPPPQGLVPSCQQAGVLGTVAGVIGAIQASEAVKWILGQGSVLVGRLLVYDGMRCTFTEFKVERDSGCAVCGDHPSVKALIDYEEFCSAAEAGQRQSQPREGCGCAQAESFQPV